MEAMFFMISPLKARSIISTIFFVTEVSPYSILEATLRGHDYRKAELIWRPSWWLTITITTFGITEAFLMAQYIVGLRKYSRYSTECVTQQFVT